MKELKVFLIFLFISIFSLLEAKELIKKKVLYINSYHTGLYWSDGIEKAIKNTLRKSKIPISFKKIQMDTKRNSDEAYKLRIAQKIKTHIKEFKPDVVITSDDNAAKYVIVPYFKNSSIPFIFCGVNASAEKYGFPLKNVTGMIEVQLVTQIVDELKKYAKGSRIGYLKGDSLSSKIEVEFFEKLLNQKINKRLVRSVNEWKENFLYLQKSVDILLIGNGGAIKDWDKYRDDIKIFVDKYNKIVSGTWDSDVSDLVLLTYGNRPEEQGIWAAKKAIELLEGKKISSIPIVANEQADIYINTTIAKKLHIVFPFDMIDNAELVK